MQNNVIESNRTIFTLTQNRRVGIALMFVSAGLMSFVPSFTDPLSVAFIAITGFTFSCWLFEPIRGCHTNLVTISLSLFVLACMVSILPALHFKTSSDSWIRGLIPFLVLMSHYLSVSAINIKDVHFILNSVHIACYVWALKICVLGWPYIIGVFFGGAGRLTYYVEDTLIPFGIIGLSLSLFNPSKMANKLRSLQILVFLVIILACVYRSQILIALFLLSIRIYHSHPKMSLTFLFVGCITVFFIPLQDGDSAIDSGLLESIKGRFDKAILYDLEDRRTLESLYAFERFKESPIIGVGLGHQVPVSEIETASNALHLESDTVPYIHNLWMYMLMDLGIFGLATYCIMSLTPVLRLLRCCTKKDDLSKAEQVIGITIATILVFSTCQACFRSVQVNLVMAMLAGASCATNQLRRTTDCLT